MKFFITSNEEVRTKMIKHLATIRFAMAAALAFGLLAFASEAGAQTAIFACGPITAPGAYILTDNLTAAGDCLVVAAGVPNVSIDLNGFTILGDGTGNGISSAFGVFEGLIVRNGTIKNFNTGLNLFGNTMLIERVQVIRNTGTGLTAVENVMVKDSIFGGNVVGLDVGEGSVLIGNVASFNSSDGMRVSGAGTTVINNSARRNTGRGLVVTCPSNIIGNTATGNTGGNLVLQGVGCNSNNNVAP